MHAKHLILLLMALILFADVKSQENAVKKYYVTIGTDNYWTKPFRGYERKQGRAQLIKIEGGAIQVLMDGEYGYVVESGIIKDDEYLEFKRNETQRKELIFQEILTSYGDSSIFIIRARGEGVDLYDKPAGRIISYHSRDEIFMIIGNELNAMTLENFKFLKAKTIVTDSVIYGYVHMDQVELNRALEASIIGMMDNKQSEIQKTNFERRKSELTGKYGALTAQRIMKGEVWIGMTIEQAIESTGRPKVINETVTERGIEYQYVYDNLYLYFKEGKLKSYQKRYN